MTNAPMTFVTTLAGSELGGGAPSIGVFDATFFALVALFVFLGVAAKMGAFKTLFGALDQKASKIAKDLDEAHRLRVEAERLLASYQVKMKEAQTEADAIVTRAKAEAEKLASEARIALEEQIARRTRQAEDRIVRAEAEALAEVRAKAADAATKAAEAVIIKKISADDQNRLFEAGLADVAKSFQS